MYRRRRRRRKIRRSVYSNLGISWFNVHDFQQVTHDSNHDTWQRKLMTGTYFNEDLKGSGRIQEWLKTFFLQMITELCKISQNLFCSVFSCLWQFGEFFCMCFRRVNILFIDQWIKPVYNIVRCTMKYMYILID